MKSSIVFIEHPEGLHARPASIFVREAGKFKSEIIVSNNNTTVNGKSIMGILMLSLSPGSQVTISAEGSDEIEAVETLKKILAGKS